MTIARPVDITGPLGFVGTAILVHVLLTGWYA
jgi:hypothetical protein